MKYDDGLYVSHYINDDNVFETNIAEYVNVDCYWFVNINHGIDTSYYKNKHLIDDTNHCLEKRQKIYLSFKEDGTKNRVKMRCDIYSSKLIKKSWEYCGRMYDYSKKNVLCVSHHKNGIKKYEINYVNGTNFCIYIQYYTSNRLKCKTISNSNINNRKIFYYRNGYNKSVLTKNHFYKNKLIFFL